MQKFCTTRGIVHGAHRAGQYGERKAGRISSSTPLRRYTCTDCIWFNRATDPSNVRVVDDAHLSVSGMTCQEKMSKFLGRVQTADRLGVDQGKQSRETLGQEPLSAYRDKCNLCSSGLFWAFGGDFNWASFFSKEYPTSQEMSTQHLFCRLPKYGTTWG